MLLAQIRCTDGLMNPYYKEWALTGCMVLQQTHTTNNKANKNPLTCGFKKCQLESGFQFFGVMNWLHTFPVAFLPSVRSPAFITFPVVFYKMHSSFYDCHAKTKHEGLNLASTFAPTRFPDMPAALSCFSFSSSSLSNRPGISFDRNNNSTGVARLTNQKDPSSISWNFEIRMQRCFIVMVISRPIGIFMAQNTIPPHEPQAAFPRTPEQHNLPAPDV